jgi:hypothetical protein
MLQDCAILEEFGGHVARFRTNSARSWTLELLSFCI